MVIARSRLQAIDEQFVILVVDECGLLVESAQDHVLRLVGGIKTGKPCHAGLSKVALVHTRRSEKLRRRGLTRQAGLPENGIKPRQNALAGAYGLFETLWS